MALRSASVGSRSSGEPSGCSGREIEIGSNPETGAYDIPYSVTDNARVTAATGWAPKRDIPGLLDEIFAWFEENRALLQTFYGTETR